MSVAPHKKIRACLFDMDGLLINSEEIYTEVTNQILEEHGKGKLPWEIKIQLQGRPGPDVSNFFFFLSFFFHDMKANNLGC